MVSRLLGVLAGATLSLTANAFAQFSLPKPEVFARAEDQKRARLLEKPCAPSDEGRGCYRFGGDLVRERPCLYHVEADVVSSLPLDQCYKMDPPRRFRGIWIDEFEGQQFIPEGTTPPEWPRGDPKSPGWRKQADLAIAGSIWLDVSRTDVRRQRQRRGGRVFVEFIGRKTMYPGNYGHMGMFGQEIIVDRLISRRECPRTGACR